MATKLTKPVKRVSGSIVRDCGKIRNLVVTLYPNDTIGLRPEGTRQKREERVTLTSCYALAVRQRVAAERIEREAKKKAKKAERKNR